MEWSFTKPDPGFDVSLAIHTEDASLSRIEMKICPVEILSVGDTIAPGHYRVHSQFRRAVNYMDGQKLLSLVDPSVGPGPSNIVVTNPLDCEVDFVVINHKRIIIRDVTYAISTALRYDSHITIPEKSSWSALLFHLPYLKQILCSLAPAKSLVLLAKHSNHMDPNKSFEKVLSDRFYEGTSLISSGRIFEGVSAIKGIGFGLTPSGDDYIAGLLIALNICQKISGKNIAQLIDEIYSVAESSNPLSAAFLKNAKEGRVSEKMKRLIAALFCQDREEILQRLSDLLTIGATSGADLAAGLFMGLEKVRLYGY